MDHLKHSVLAFLDNIGNKLNCELQFVPFKGKTPAFLNKDLLFYEKDQIGMPLFFKGEFYGCLFVSSSRWNQKSFKLLELFIKEGLMDFFEDFGTYFRYLLSAKTADSNVIPFLKEETILWDKLAKEPKVLFVSGDSHESLFESALKIHNLTAHLAFIRLDELMKKEEIFSGWSSFTTFFLPDWMNCEDWQKQQVKDFISSKSPLPLKIIIGLKKEDVEWKIS